MPERKKKIGQMQRKLVIALTQLDLARRRSQRTNPEIAVAMERLIEDAQTFSVFLENVAAEPPADPETQRRVEKMMVTIGEFCQDATKLYTNNRYR